MIQRIQINANDGSFGAIVKKGSGAKGQINTGSSWYGKKISVNNPLTNQTQICNKQSLIDFLKTKPEGQNLQKKGLFKKGSSDADVQEAFNEFVLSLKPAKKKSEIISPDRKDQALKHIMEEIQTKGANVPSEKPLDVVKQYAQSLPKHVTPEGDEINVTSLPVDVKTDIAILLGLALIEENFKSQKSAKKWINEQFKSIPFTLEDQNEIKIYLLTESQRIIDKA